MKVQPIDGCKRARRKGGMVGRELVVPASYPPTAFDPVEEPLDRILRSLCGRTFYYKVDYYYYYERLI